MNVAFERTIRFHQRIIVRLLVPITTLLILLFVVLGGFVWLTYQNDQRATDAVPRTVANDVQNAVTSFFALQQLNLSLVVQSLSTSDPSVDQRRFLEKVVTADPAVIELVIIDEQRNETYRATEATVGRIVSITEPTIKKSIDLAFATRKSSISEPQLTERKTPYIVWYTPIVSETGRTVAVALVTIDISTFWQYVTAATPKDAGAHVYITDPKGVILVSNKKVEPSEYTSVVSDTLFRIGEQDAPRRYIGVLGEWVVGKAEPLPPTDWTVIAEVSFDDLTKDSRRNFILFALVVAFFSTLVFYTFYSFNYNLMRPLTTFRHAIAALSMGNYATRIRVDTMNEFTLLADVINAMAASIETQTSENVAKLKKTISDLDRSAKTLMKRDEELSRANDRLLRLDHAKTEFVSIAAHQLRTPLSALKWAQQMLLEGEAGAVTDAQKTLLLQSQESVRRMVTLVNDLLAADHLEYGKVAYVMKPASVEQVVEQCVHELTPMATEHRIQIDLDLSQKRTVSMIDQERIKEAFLNIMNNAIKYTPDGGKVTIRANYGMGRVVLTFTDTGIGIPEGDRDRLFEKFVRMENAKKIDANGSGLGLFIVKKVIDAHGGKIWFDSVEGQGTTFFVELPVNPSQ